MLALSTRTKTHLFFAGWAVVLALILHPAPTMGADFAVHSETTGQAYRIRGRDGLFTIPRSRVTQLLSLYGTDLLGLSDELYTPVDLSLVVNLGIDHDFGVKDSSLKPGSDGFIPLLERTNLGMFTGYLSGRIGLDPMFGFKLGRIVLLDPAGYVAMDGVDLDLRFARIFRVGFAMGLSLVPDVRLTMVDFSPEGVAWGDRKGYPGELHEEVTPPRPRPVILARLAMAIPLAGTLSLSYHRSWADPHFENVAIERIGLGLELAGPDRPVSLTLRSAYDLVWSRVAELDGQVAIHPGPVGSFGLRFLHMVPLFDTSSIFNVFDVDPHDEISTFVRLGQGGRTLLSLSASAGLRFTQPVLPDDGGPDRVSDINGYLVLGLRLDPVNLTWTARGSGGQSGILAGTTARAQVNLLDGRLVPSVGLSLWFWDDPLRRSHHGLSLGESTSLSFRPVDIVRLVGVLDVFHNRVSGTGLAATLQVVVDL